MNYPTENWKSDLNDLLSCHYPILDDYDMRQLLKDFDEIHPRVGMDEIKGYLTDRGWNILIPLIPF